MSTLQTWLQGIDLDWIITELFVVLSAVISLSFHEFSHAYIARCLGDDTAERMGRLTLNPLRHLSWSGLLMLAIFRFGWAKPVPVDMRRFQNPKAGMALTALAGPVSNVLLALMSCIALQLLYLADRSVALDYFIRFFTVMLLINAGLAVFNLIPISPLDGSKVLAVLLPDNAYDWLMRYERYGFIALWLLLITDVLDKPLAFLRGGLINGLLGLTNLIFGTHLQY